MINSQTGEKIWEWQDWIEKNSGVSVHKPYIKNNLLFFQKAYWNYCIDLNTGKIGGIITVGSPLNGTQLANSYNDLTLKNFLDNGYYQMSKGLNNEGLLTTIKTQFPDIQQLIDAVEAFKYNNFVSSSGFNLSQATINDLMANSNNTIRTDNNKTATSTRKLSIYGSEADPAFWRLIGSAKYNHNPDDGVVNRNKLSSGFTLLRNIHNNGFFGFLESGDNQYQVMLYQDAIDWVQNTSTTGWQRVIGAGDFERQSLCTTSRTINWSELSYCFSQFGSNYQAVQNCINQHSYNVTVCYTPFANAASDGVGPASSQIGQYSTSWSNAEAPVRVDILNHVDEPANNQKMRDAFNQVFRNSNSYFFIQ